MNSCALSSYIGGVYVSLVYSEGAVYDAGK